MSSSESAAATGGKESPGTEKSSAYVENPDYRYISCESFSQLDALLPLTYLTRLESSAARLAAVTNIIGALRTHGALPTLVWTASVTVAQHLFQGMLKARHRASSAASSAAPFPSANVGLSSALRSGLAILTIDAPSWYVREVCARCAASTLDVVLVAGGCDAIAQLPSPRSLRRSSVIILAGEDATSGAGLADGGLDDVDARACQMVMRFASPPNRSAQGHCVFATALGVVRRAFSGDAPGRSPCRDVPLFLAFAAQAAGLPGVVRFRIAQRIVRLTHFFAKVRYILSTVDISMKALSMNPAHTI